MKLRTSTSKASLTGKFCTKNNLKLMPKSNLWKNSEMKCNWPTKREPLSQLNTKQRMDKKVKIKPPRMDSLNNRNPLSNMFWIHTQGQKRSTVPWFLIPQSIRKTGKTRLYYLNLLSLSKITIKFLNQKTNIMNCQKFRKWIDPTLMFINPKATIKILCLKKSIIIKLMKTTFNKERKRWI